MKPLRPYQEHSISELRESLMRGEKPVLSAPTGAGKTRIASEIFSLARARHRRVVFVVPFLSLINQTWKAFVEAGIDEREIGIIQANHPLTDYSRPVQIASIDTLVRRPKLPETDIVIFDECHKQSKVHERWMLTAPDSWFIGLSATPWARGMDALWSKMIIVSTLAELIEQGYLSPFKYFAPAQPDLSGIKITAGDYQQDQLAERMSRADLVADIVSTWLNKGEMRPTFCFAVNRKHAAEIQAQFEAAGISAGYVDAYTEVEEREVLIEKLRVGDIKVLCNVGTMTTGVDAPFVSCIILARPTKSEMLFIQIVGRGLRIYPEKKDCLILDHSNTGLTLGRPDEITHNDFVSGTKADAGTKEKEEKEKKEKLPRLCFQCQAVLPAATKVCPECGTAIKMSSSEIYTRDGDLAELGKDGKIQKVTPQIKQRWWSGLLYIAEEKGKSRSWALANYKARFGVWPRGVHDTPEWPTAEIRMYLQHKAIAYAKMMEKKNKMKRAG
jgi:DNA repair protein RadD